MLIWYLCVVVGVFLCSCSQILLKKSAEKKYKRMYFSMLNWRVITSYVIFLLSLLVNIMAMSKGVNLKDVPILESLGYIFVPILSAVFLREKIDISTYFSMFLIFLGIIVFYL